MSHVHVNITLIYLGLTDKDEVDLVVGGEGLEVVDIPREAFEVPGENRKRIKFFCFNILS